MRKKPTRSITVLMLILAVLVTGCSVRSKPTEAPPAAEVKNFVTWYQYDHENTDPANDEAVGNAYIRDTIPQFNAAFAGKWNWVNVPKPWKQVPPELVAAVQAGGDVPDIVHSRGSYLLDLVRNGAVQDLTDWAKAQPWYADMNPGALRACTAQDGRLYCIPIAQFPYVTFVWADRFPNGYPKTPEQFLAEAERLKGEGHYIMTYFGSTSFDGDGAARAVWTAFSSFGGAYDDGKGNLLLNTPENVAAVEFLRELTVQGYVPEVVFAGGFQEEEAFKDASAASIPTGLDGHRYMRPLTAPDGTKYVKENGEDMLDAVEAGDIVLSPFVAPAGNKPGCGLSIQALYIPTGAKNVEAAHDYINWLMTDLKQNADWVTRAASGIPSLGASYNQPAFQSKFYQQARAVADASACRPASGSLARWDEAKALIMNAVYKLVKQDQTADIAAELQKAQDEYNSNK